MSSTQEMQARGTPWHLWVVGVLALVRPRVHGRDLRGRRAAARLRPRHVPTMRAHL